MYVRPLHLFTIKTALLGRLIDKSSSAWDSSHHSPHLHAIQAIPTALLVCAHKQARYFTAQPPPPTHQSSTRVIVLYTFYKSLIT